MSNKNSNDNDNRTLVVKNLPHWDIYLIDLLEKFEKYGRILHIKILRDYQTGRCKGIGFVKFETEKDCGSSLKEMNHFYLNDRRVRIERAH